MLSGKYFLNGLDMFLTYGFVAAKGCADDFLRARKRKEVLTNDFLDENGSDYDLLSAPKYEDRVINMPGYIYVHSNDAFNQFKAKYNALKAAFNVPGTLAVMCAEAGETVQAFYLDMPDFKKSTRLRGTNVILCEISIQLKESQAEM